MTEDIDPVRLAKSVLWEEAKGKLRAMVAADGCRSTGGAHRAQPFRFEIVEAAINAFINEFENEGLHE